MFFCAIAGDGAWCRDCAEEVEPVDAIRRRFTASNVLGSLSL